MSSVDLKELPYSCLLLLLLKGTYFKESLRALGDLGGYGYGTTYSVHIPWDYWWRVWGVSYGTAYSVGIPWDYWWRIWCLRLTLCP